MDGQEKKKRKTAKKTRGITLSAFTIILILIFVLAIITHLIPGAKCVHPENGDIVSCAVIQEEGLEEILVDGSGVYGATLSQTLIAPILGFENAIDVGIFIFVLGGFLKIVGSTGALETGVQALIKKLKGKELVLIAILMFIFSIGGTTYGMLEETVGFYALLSVAMVAAGMDTLVASATVLLGAGSGVLGSTINPFAVGAAIDALPEGMVINQGYIILIGVLLWLTSYALCTIFVLAYAKRVIKKKGSTILSLQEQKYMKETYGAKEVEDVKLTKKQTTTLWLFFLTFVVMIIGFIPWGSFNLPENLLSYIISFIVLLPIGILIFRSVLDKSVKHSGLIRFISAAVFAVLMIFVVKLISVDVLHKTYPAIGNLFVTITGQALGDWWFYEAALWFLIMTIIIGVVNRKSETVFVDTFVDGADDMVGVILIIAIARGASVLMSQTHLDNYIIFNAAQWLSHVPQAVFAPLNYLLHVVLSVLVPSSSGLASLSAPIMGPLAHQVGYSVEATLMGMVAANGLVNLFTPTCGAIMGGLRLAGLEFTTWLRWVFKVILSVALVNMIILTAAMILL